MFIWVLCTGGLEAAQIDEVVDAVNDIAQAGAKAFFSKDEAEMKKYTTETLPAGLINIEKRLESGESWWSVHGRQHSRSGQLSRDQEFNWESRQNSQHPGLGGGQTRVRNLTFTAHWH